MINTNGPLEVARLDAIKVVSCFRSDYLIDVINKVPYCNRFVQDEADRKLPTRNRLKRSLICNTLLRYTCNSTLAT